MELTPYQLAWISGGFSLLGVLVGGLCTYRFALQLQRTASLREAGRRLREAFSEELATGTAPGFRPDITFAHALEQAFSKHSVAVQEFSFHLPQRKRRAFQEAWQKYWEVGGSVRFFDYYMEPNAKEIFRERVNAILKFTET